MGIASISPRTWRRLALGASVFIFFVAPLVLAGTTEGDLKKVSSHVYSEITGDVLNILAWVSFGLGCVTAVAKMNLSVVLTMFGLFLVFILGPDVISGYFSALI